MSIFRSRLEAIFFAVMFNGMAIGALIFFNPQLTKPRKHSVLSGLLTKPTFLKTEQGNSKPDKPDADSTAIADQMTPTGARP